MKGSPEYLERRTQLLNKLEKGRKWRLFTQSFDLRQLFLYKGNFSQQYRKQGLTNSRLCRSGESFANRLYAAGM